MMKKILFTLSILLLATGCLMAQEITNTELKKFVEELRSPSCGPRNETKKEEKGIYHINSVNEDSYKAFRAVIEKYDIYFAEEIFGMELMFNTREGGSQTIIFQGDIYGLAIIDNAHSLDLSVTIVKGSAVKLFFEIDDTGIKEEHSTEVYFKYNVEEPAEVTDISEGNISIERLLPGDIIIELFDHYMPMIQELEKKSENAKADSIRQVWNNESRVLQDLWEKSESPSRVKIPCTGNIMITIPKGAKQGLYEWINSIGTCRAKGQKTTFASATDIAALAATKAKQTQTSYSLQGYSNEMKAIFANEVPGGEPVYIYRRSTTTAGYETMKKDLEQFFYLDGKNKNHRYKGFGAIERIDTEEYCFLHLYDGSTSILIYDSPADKHCQMDIIVGGVELFNDAVNDISIDHEKGHATKRNIIIRDGDVDFIDSEVEINGVTYDCGVHFTTGYMKKLK